MIPIYQSSTRIPTASPANRSKPIARASTVPGLDGETGRASREFARHDQRWRNRALFHQPNRSSRHPANHPATHDCSGYSGSQRRHQRDIPSIVGRDGRNWPLLLVPTADGLQVWQHRDQWRQAQVIGQAIDARQRPSVANPGYTNSFGFDLSVGDVNGDGRDDLIDKTQ